jgi:hypothetical protein
MAIDVLDLRLMPGIHLFCQTIIHPALKGSEDPKINESFQVDFWQRHM